MVGSLVSMYISMALTLIYNKNKLYKTLYYLSIEVLNFNFLEKRSETSFFTKVCRCFKKKCFSCYNLLTYQIYWSDCFYFSRYWPICALNFEINLIRLIEPIHYTTKKSIQNYKYFE